VVSDNTIVKEVILVKLTLFGSSSREFCKIFRIFFPFCSIECTDGDHRTDEVLLQHRQIPTVILASTQPTAHTACRFPGACVVTCGMSPRDSVSCSSCTGQQAVISVVRELPILHGGFVEVQDICLPLSPRLSADRTVLLTAVSLCAGISPLRFPILYARHV
jgi:hypothetical protein